MAKIPFKVRDYYDHDETPGLACTAKEDMTQQHFEPECNINNIIERYDMVPQSMYRPLAFGDFAQAGDFLDAQNLILEARANFEALPAKVRDRFANDPARFLAFMGDKANEKEAYDLGLAVKPEKPVPTVQQVVVGTLNPDGTFVPQGDPTVMPKPPDTK